MGLPGLTVEPGNGRLATGDIQVRIDPRAEWEQIFEEAWRVMKFRFYDPDMHGRDWDAIKAHYKPLLAHVGSYEDVQDLSNQMIGELNASHVGVSRLSSVDMETEYSTRLPGIELEPAQGAYRVSHVYRDGPADKEWLDTEVGDFVLAIDGQEQAGQASGGGPVVAAYKAIEAIVGILASIRIEATSRCQGSVTSVLSW